MQKQELLDEITSFAQKNLLTRNELLDAFERGNAHEEQMPARHLAFFELMYYIGGAIIFIGIAILIYQNWFSLNSITKILCTLGSAVAAYIVGILFAQDKRIERLAQVFFFISALVMPLGLLVTFNIAGFETYTSGTNSIVSLLLTAVFFSSYMLLRRDLFLFFTIVFATWLFFAVTSFLFYNSQLYDWTRFYEYRALIAGLSYMVLGYAFQKSGKDSLSGYLYGFGILGFLGAALALGGWSPEQHVFWEVVYPGLVIAAMFLSVYLRSRSFLVFGSIFLMAYILKITAEYFTRGLGWPVSLVLAGLALIGIGYLAFHLNKKYLGSPKRMA